VLWQWRTGVWTAPARSSADEFSKTPYGDRITQVDGKDKLDARATSLVPTIRSFNDAKWKRILDGAQKFSEARGKATIPVPIAHPTVEVNTPFLLSDAGEVSTSEDEDMAEGQKGEVPADEEHASEPRPEAFEEESLEVGDKLQVEVERQDE